MALFPADRDLGLDKAQDMVSLLPPSDMGSLAQDMALGMGSLGQDMVSLLPQLDTGSLVQDMVLGLPLLGMGSLAQDMALGMGSPAQDMVPLLPLSDMGSLAQVGVGVVRGTVVLLINTVQNISRGRDWNQPLQSREYYLSSRPPPSTKLPQGPNLHIHYLCPAGGHRVEPNHCTPLLTEQIHHRFGHQRQPQRRLRTQRVAAAFDASTSHEVRGLTLIEIA